MKQPFATEELKDELERKLGFRLRELTRLDGASALNFKAVREADGLPFAVKCSPPSRQRMFDNLVRHLEETRGTKAVRRLFEKECPTVFRSHNLICLEWCAGERLLPDQLTDDQLTAFLDEYQAFSAALQKSACVLPHDPTSQWRTMALKACDGLAGRGLRRLIERELPAEEVAYREDRVRVIHGDFHHGNFLFTGGRVNGFFDLEEFCGGYPADDIVRYFVCAAEHLRWYDRRRRARILDRFGVAVRHLPYPQDEWLAAVDGLLVRKLYMKLRDGRPNAWRTFNLLFRSGLYLRMKQIVRAACASSGGRLAAGQDGQ